MIYYIASGITIVAACTGFLRWFYQHAYDSGRDRSEREAARRAQAERDAQLAAKWRATTERLARLEAERAQAESVAKLRQ